MGRNPVFPKVQNDWIAARIPKYIEKTAFGKPSIPGQPPAADDDDLLQWVRQCRDQFEVQFKSELDAKSNDSVVVNASSSGGASKGTGSAETFMESVRTRFDRKFLNAKARAKYRFEKQKLHTLSSISSDHHVAQSASHSTPNLPFTIIKTTPITGRRLFEQFSSDSINKHVNLARTKANIDRKQHPAMYQAELKCRWDLLTNKERKGYETRAVELNREAKDGNKIYRNQEVFVGDLTNMLCDLIGHESHQIGNASVHLLYGYRDASGTLKTGSIGVRANPVDVSFDAFDPKYNECTMTPWSQYCQEYVQRNEHIDRKVVEDPPSFPALAEDAPMTVQDLRQILQEYIEAQWAYARRLTPGTQMDWDDITGLLSTYIAPELNPALLMLDNPAHMSIKDIFNVIGFIQSHQSQHGAFSLFLIGGLSSSPHTQAALVTPDDVHSLDDFQIAPIAPTGPMVLPSSANVKLGSMDATTSTTESRRITDETLATDLGTVDAAPRSSMDATTLTTESRRVIDETPATDPGTVDAAPRSSMDATTLTTESCRVIDQTPATDLGTVDAAPRSRSLSPVDEAVPASPHQSADNAAHDPTPPAAAAQPMIVSPDSSIPPGVPSFSTTDPIPVIPESIAPEIQTSTAQPSGTKRKLHTSTQPNAAAKRIKGAPSDANLRRSSRQKTSRTERTDQDHPENEALVGNVAGVSRTGKPLKNTKNWIYVPRN